jgi:hypothetical protein
MLLIKASIATSFRKQNLIFFKGYIDQLELIQAPIIKEHTYIMKLIIVDVWTMIKIQGVIKISSLHSNY